MSKTDPISNFMSISEPTSNDYQNILNLISNENEVSSKFYKLLDNLQSMLLKIPSDIENNFSLLKFVFSEQLLTKNKHIYDFILNWLLSLYYKLEGSEENLILTLFYESIVNNSYAKIDLYKKINIGENYFYKILEIKNKNKKLLELLVKHYGRNVLDYYLIILYFKIKSSSQNKFEIETEKWSLKIIAKYYTDIYSYFLEIIFYSFYQNHSANCRKFILFVNLILIKTFGLLFLDKFFNFVYLKIKNTQEIFIILKNLDFTILNENYTYTYQSIDTSIGFNKAILNLLFEMISTQNLKLDDKEKEAIEINEMKILNKLNVLKNFILLVESFINQILFQGGSNINIVLIYTFYYSLQLKFIKNFVIFPEAHKRKYYENQVNIGNITKVLPKYNKKYEEINSIFSEIVSLFYNNNGTSLIFQNWLIFLYKNCSIIDAYKALRIFLLTKKEGGLIYTLLKMHYEISKFYPCLWKVVLDSFLIDSSNRNAEENYNLITNLKFIFYYEISLKSSTTFVKSNFYDSLSYDCTVILKFFREKFAILTSIFFSDENLIENIKNSTFKTGNDMDICFETYIKQNTKTNENENWSSHNNNSMLVDSTSIDSNIEKIHNKTKIEILNILSFLLNTYNDSEIVNHDINKFVLDLIDVYVEKRESQNLLDYIANIFKILFKIYKKNTTNSKIISAPIKIIFVNLIKHILNKILSGFNSEKYYQIFLQIFSHLNQNNEKEDISNMIIFTIKELIYKNVDNQSFKNPFVLKNMQGLNDIDEAITEKEYLVDLLLLLNESNQQSLFGFYMRFLNYSISRLKVDMKIQENLKKVLNMFLKTGWLSDNYRILIDALFNVKEVKNREKILLHISNYLKEFSPNAELNKENLETKNKFKIQFKTLIFENIKYIR